MKTYLPIIGWVFSAWIVFGINPVSAEQGGYFGVQYAMATYEEDDIGLGDPPDFDIGALVLRGGYEVNPNFAVEGRFGLGISDETKVWNSALGPLDTTVELDDFIGVYARGILPLNDVTSLYGIVGWTDISITATVSDGVTTASNSDSDSDMSFGFGADFNVGAGAINLEYMSYYSDDAVDVTAIGVGYTVKF